jgi:hypothetical protein
MGRYVEIKKIKEEGNVYYYSVQSLDYTDIPPLTFVMTWRVFPMQEHIFLIHLQQLF